MELLVRTGTYWHVLDQGDFGKNEYFWTFCKSVHDGRRGGEKSNEEALWLRQERLKILSLMFDGVYSEIGLVFKVGRFFST